MLFLWFFLCSTDPNQPDLVSLKPAWESVQAEPSSDTGALTAAAGIALLGMPYVEKSLEVEGEERLVLFFEGYDCVTLLETALALARTGKMEDFPRELQRMRYRDGKIEGYPSRLHYTSDWISDNERKGIVRDITRDLGGVVHPQKVSFMTEHPGAYRQLSDPRNVTAMQAVEEAINGRTHYYIPKERVAEVETQLRNGDLIAITTNIKGLDITHVGIAIRRGARAYLLHASSTAKQVIISEQPLPGYLAKNKRQTGVMVLRPL